MKRTCNRAPGPYDQWWAAHQESCGGTFMKIKGPDKPKKQNVPKELKRQQGKDLRTFFPSTNKQISSTPKLSDANNVKGFNSGTSGFGGAKGVCSNYCPAICACKAFVFFFVGPIKTNGGGTLLLNPNTKTPVTKPIDRQTSIVSVFPPSSYPGLSSDPLNTNTISGSNKTPIRHTSAGGNLRNVIGLANLNSSPGGTSGAAGRVNANNANAIFSGSGCQVGASGHSSPSSKNSSNGEVDRNHLRELWLKRFDKNKTNRSSDINIEKNKKISGYLESDAEAPTGEGTEQLFSINLMK